MTAILVPEAQTRAAIAVIRSLGRAGYEVHACSPQKDALGGRSAYAAKTIVQPPYASPEFLPWLRQYIVQNRIRMIVPSAGFLLTVKPVFTELRELLPVCHNPEILYKFYSKAETIRAYMDAPPELKLMDHHPDSVIVDLRREADCPVPRNTGYGYYLKFEGPVSSEAREGDLSDLKFVSDAAQLQDVVDDARQHWTTALIQSGCTGRQKGVSVLMDKGEPLAVSCVRDKYLEPHSKGTMSLRESCYDDLLVEDAVRRLKYLNWDGCAMVEYRQEDDGTFNVIEINARYWQYLHLDIKSGVDFPRFQAEWFLDGKRDFDYTAKMGVVSRDTWPGEVAHLVNVLVAPDNSIGRKLKSVGMFFGRFLLYRDDMNFPGDKRLYLLNFGKYLRSEVKNIVQKIAHRRG